MKIRSGFVSNSSSSSFLIYGIQIDEDAAQDAVKKAIKNGHIFKDYDGNEMTFEDIVNEGMYEVTERLCSILPKTSSLSIEAPSNYDSIYVGASWDSVKDDETGKEFKNRVFNDIKALGLKVNKTDLGTHAESWYNG